MKLAIALGLAGIGVSVQAVAAQADDLSALKSVIEGLTARVAQLESQPALPPGERLISISEGTLRETPGVFLSNRERLSLQDRATYLNVLPTADTPAGPAIS